MTLRLYNTLTRTKEEFVPIDPANVRMYVCGPTVYDYAHIGNARPVIVFDLLFRLLRHLYGESAVTYVRNVTDVDDKINARAAERGVPIREITEGTLKQFHADIAALGVLAPTVEPRATEHIAEMRTLIERLVQGGHAYVAEDHVLFDVPAMPDYGRLSKRPLDEMEAGARVDVAPYKRSPLDFVLWKPSKPGEPSWPSPAGIAAPGRPGWHIECSAMSWKHLGEVFDIHGGGIDLVFPHHENEVAQTRCAFGTPVMANVWMHNGFLQVEGEKMSKSLGNFVTINELLATDVFGGRSWPGEVLRLAMLRTHYRQPIDWTVRALEEASKLVDRWSGMSLHADVPLDEIEAALPPSILERLLDDLNTPAAITELHALTSEVRTGSQQQRRELASALKFFGLLPKDLTGSVSKQLEARLERGDAKVAELREKGINLEDLIASRSNARAQKNWKESDRIRDELAAMGIVLKDNKDGTTTWEVAR
ncbi:MAG TPA: cysteine--tRNA ligase [Beijerinckiaceae bacterium]|jgi:cysteinyl-tRNA synthetase